MTGEHLSVERSRFTTERAENHRVNPTGGRAWLHCILSRRLVGSVALDGGLLQDPRQGFSMYSWGPWVVKVSRASRRSLKFLTSLKILVQPKTQIIHNSFLHPYWGSL